jgi:hypothetical protein
LKQPVKIKFQNGITYRGALNEILNEVTNDFDFIESDQPDFILFGPYGNDLPPKGNYTRIGYFCENIQPDLSICEWAFGIPTESHINDPKYKRIQWHGLDAEKLVKHDINAEQIFNSKSKFCNFLYSNPVPYREEFFRQLSKYKTIDAPGKSMNNMPSFDGLHQSNRWEAKREFLSPYKFTIAFENYVYPGYQTEKLYDAMLCNSLPIYCGDPNIGEIFNTKSFLNVPDYVKPNYSSMVQTLENLSQLNFIDILPQFHHKPKDRLQRKLKSIGKNLKMKLQFNQLDFSALIDQIIAVDKDPDLYRRYLQQPWFIHNIPPANASLKSRWIKIFHR